MKIAKNSKPTLNLLISYYRKQYAQTSESFLPKNFIYDGEDHPICTLSTLSRLENNKTQCFDKIYYAFLDNLNMFYISEDRIDNLIHSVNINILKYAEINDRDKLTRLLSNSIKIIEVYQDYIIYNEQLEVYKIFLDYYRDFVFNEALLDKHLELIEIMSDSLKPMFIEIVALYFTRYSINPTKTIIAIKSILSCEIKSIIVDYIYMLLYFYKFDFLKSKEHGELLLASCKKAKNNSYLCKTYNLLAALYTTQNPSLSIEYLNKAIDAFDETKDFQDNLDAYLINLANTACMSGAYTLAVETYKKIEWISPQKLVVLFPYHLYALDKINAPLSEKRFVFENLKLFISEMKSLQYYPIYELFGVEYNVFTKNNLPLVLNDIIEIKFILENVPPILKIVEYELSKICKENNTYHLYNYFMKVFH